MLLSSYSCDIWAKSLKSILSFVNYNTFKNDRIVKQKKLYGYKIVAMAWKILETQISKFKCFLTTLMANFLPLMTSAKRPASAVIIR